jgi:LmbE family N-acetylglucosaminyl deacetylase
MSRTRDGIVVRTRRLWENGFSRERILRSFARSPALWPETPAFDLIAPATAPAFKTLLVVAHPDDESECAALVYRITHELGGAVDQVVVTNGEAGCQYAAPAQAYYGLPLTHQAAGRKHLCKIRREEVLRASRILGIRSNYFFEQKDTGFTLDPQEGLRTWDIARIRQELLGLLQRENYDLVLTLLPEAGVHGHHQAVAVLTIQAVAELAPEQRPAVLGVRTASAEPGQFSGLPGFPLTRTSDADPVWSFDRRTPFGGHAGLDYSIIVHWVIAEHKSQGMFQMEYGRKTHECLWLFAAGGARGAARWLRFLEALRRPPDVDSPKVSGRTRAEGREYATA